MSFVAAIGRATSSATAPKPSANAVNDAPCDRGGNLTIHCAQNAETIINNGTRSANFSEMPKDLTVAVPTVAAETAYLFCSVFTRASHKGWKI
jgi:hypothetical protein